MNNLAMIQAGLSADPARWLVSGCAGFIGSNLLETHGVRTGRAALHGRVRAGDVPHAHADIGKALRELGYAPSHRLSAGLALTVPWYLARRDEGAGAGGASQAQTGGRS